MGSGLPLTGFILWSSCWWSCCPPSRQLLWTCLASSSLLGPGLPLTGFILWSSCWWSCWPPSGRLLPTCPAPSSLMGPGLPLTGFILWSSCWWSCWPPSGRLLPNCSAPSSLLGLDCHWLDLYCGLLVNDVVHRQVGCCQLVQLHHHYWAWTAINWIYIVVFLLTILLSTIGSVVANLFSSIIVNGAWTAVNWINIVVLGCHNFTLGQPRTSALHLVMTFGTKSVRNIAKITPKKKHFSYPTLTKVILSRSTQAWSLSSKVGAFATIAICTDFSDGIGKKFCMCHSVESRNAKEWWWWWNFCLLVQAFLLHNFGFVT